MLQLNASSFLITFLLFLEFVTVWFRQQKYFISFHNPSSGRGLVCEGWGRLGRYDFIETWWVSCNDDANMAIFDGACSAWILQWISGNHWRCCSAAHEPKKAQLPRYKDTGIFHVVGPIETSLTELANLWFSIQVTWIEMKWFSLAAPLDFISGLRLTSLIEIY